MLILGTSSTNCVVTSVQKGRQAYQSGNSSCEMPNINTNIQPKFEKLSMYIKELFKVCCSDTNVLPPTFLTKRSYANLWCQSSYKEENGKAFCACEAGYKLNSDGITCDKIDVCNLVQGYPPCKNDQTCVRLLGGYDCVETKTELPEPNRRSLPKIDVGNSASRVLVFELLLIGLAAFLVHEVLVQTESNRL